MQKKVKGLIPCTHFIEQSVGVGSEEDGGKKFHLSPTIFHEVK